MHLHMFVVAILISTSALSAAGQTPVRASEQLGKYFAKKTYNAGPLPTFAGTRSLLPSPIYDEDPNLVACYWKAWEIAFRHFYEPLPGTGFVSQFIDAGFNANIFLWDTAFMTMFCRFADPLVPAIASLDNFYARQHETGEICREIRRSDGTDFQPWVNGERKPLFSRWGYWMDQGPRETPITYVGRAYPTPNPQLTLDALNNPVVAWAELESYSLTGDIGRIRLVYPPLLHYYRALQKYLLQGNGLYMTDWASMDNSPRNPSLAGGGQGVDISSQMVLFARNLADMSEILGFSEERTRLIAEADDLAGTINRLMWNEKRKFYSDLSLDGSQVPVKTIAAYWTLLAGVAGPDRTAWLVSELENPATFWRYHPVPTCAADEPGYMSDGGYWHGAVWAPTNTMVIRGLERAGNRQLAATIARKHVEIVARAFKATGTIWEAYAPDAPRPAFTADKKLVKRDFVGWSGIGPIMYFLEYTIGLRAQASTNTLVWTITSPLRSGCERFRFNGHVTSLLAWPEESKGRVRVQVDSDGEYFLKMSYGDWRREFQVQRGRNRLILGSGR
jgi:hypothetical protein